MRVENIILTLFLISLPLMACGGLVSLIYLIFHVVRRAIPKTHPAQPEPQIPLAKTNYTPALTGRGPKALTIIAYAVGSLLFLLACFITLGTAETLLQGHNFTGELEADYSDYVFDALLVGGFWAHAVLVLWIAHMLRTMINTERCRKVARLLCVFVPLGTILGVLTLTCLPRIKREKNAA